MKRMTIRLIHVAWLLMSYNCSKASIPVQSVRAVPCSTTMFNVAQERPSTFDGVQNLHSLNSFGALFLGNPST